jgi:CHAT domain-containing protein
MLLDADYPVTVVPSGCTWLRAAGAGRPVADRVLVAAGPGLPGAEAEAARVAAIHDVDGIVGASATTERVAALLDGAGLAHLAAHATIRPSSPLFSSLQLADGPLTAYDLEGVPRAPSIVVLPACSAGHATARSAGELLGLSTVLLDGGASCLVAPTIPIPDETSVETVVDFHRHLRGGATTSQAVAAAVHDLDADDPAGLVASCTLTCFGRGDTKLPPSLRAPGARTRG